MKIICTLLWLFVSMPIWYFLQYQILVRVNATELMFFLFWVYLPVTVFATVIAKLAEES